MDDATVTAARLVHDGPLRLVALGAGGGELRLAPGTWIVGRGEGCDLRVDDPALSRRHFSVGVGAAVRVTDLGSSGGTWRGGERLPAGEAVPLVPGMVLEAGRTTFLLGGTGDAEASTPSSTEALLPLLAASTLPVLVHGESGVGKEVLARRIHALSPRARGPFVALNCAALPEGLIESELFGHERGAFTGALAERAGVFEQADGGTLLLDEVGEMPLALQVRLLRVLETREVVRLGARRARTVDVRILAATWRDLRERVASGDFREDLYWRLDGLAVTIPPLRERKDQLPQLARTLLADHGAPALGPAALSRLLAHSWPGNVRELRNCLARAALLSGGSTIGPEHIEIRPPLMSPTPPSLRDDLAEVERRRILEALDATAGNQTRAAALLGIPLRTFVNRLAEHGIARPRRR